MTNEGLILLLRKQLSADPALTQIKLAAKIGVTVQYLNDVLQGHRPAGPKVMAWLGYERKTEIVKAK